MRRFGSALLIASSASLLLGVATVPADAGNFQYTTLSSNSTNVKTSTGKTVDVSVFASKDSFSNSYSVSVTLRSGSYTHGESHTWSFRPDSGSFDYSNGKGTLHTGNLPMNFGSIDLTFDKTSQSTQNCPDSGSTTTAKGTLKGGLHFNSKSSSWGNVDDNTFTFATPNFLSVSDNCTGEGNSKVICSKSISWNAPYVPGPDSASASGFTSGSGSTAKTTISGSRIVLIDNAGSITRSDFVSDAARTPLIDGNKLTVRTKKGTRVRGSATMTGGDTNKQSVKCHDGGKTATEHTTFHSGTKWTSANGLKFNETAFSDFKSATDGTNSGWQKRTFS